MAQNVPLIRVAMCLRSLWATVAVCCGQIQLNANGNCMGQNFTLLCLYSCCCSLNTFPRSQLIKFIFKIDVYLMATADEIICNGHTIVLPTLEVARTMPKMSGGTNLDWLLHIYYARRDFARCKQIIERELYRHLNPEYLYFIKGLIEREEGNNIEGLRNLQKSLDLNSKNIDTFKEIGKTLFAMGRYTQALGVFREAEELSPRADNEIFHYIGELLLRSAAGRSESQLADQERADAKAYFKKAVHCGKKLESFQRLAEIYRKEKDYQKAIDVLEACLLLSPENTDVLTEIGVIYLKINEAQKAFDRLQQVINVDKRCPRGLLAFGAILQSRNDGDGALGKYKEIAVAEPEIAELWNNIGLCFFKKQKMIVAISSLRKAIWLSPLNYNALYNLSLIYITAEQYASAFHTLAAAINLRKDSAECYMLLGICLRKLDDTENAYTAFERSVAIQRQDTVARNPLVYLNCALFCYERGRIARATEEYNRFLSDSHDLLLPTEYKFQATKLKSLLKISSTHILYSPSETTDVSETTAATTTATTTTATTTVTTTSPTMRMTRMTTTTAMSNLSENYYNTSCSNDELNSRKHTVGHTPLTDTKSSSSLFPLPLTTTQADAMPAAIYPLEVNAAGKSTEKRPKKSQKKSKSKTKSRLAAAISAII